MLGAVLREALLLAKLLEEVAVLAVVQHDVDVVRVVEVAVQFDDVWVVESPLNLKLSLHLAKKVELLQDVLEDDLERDWHPAELLHGLEDFTKLPAADGLDPHEVMYGPCLLLV